MGGWVMVDGTITWKQMVLLRLLCSLPPFYVGSLGLWPFLTISQNVLLYPGWETLPSKSIFWIFWTGIVVAILSNDPCLSDAPSHIESGLVCVPSRIRQRWQYGTLHFSLVSWISPLGEAICQATKMLEQPRGEAQIAESSSQQAAPTCHLERILRSQPSPQGTAAPTDIGPHYVCDPKTDPLS